MDKTVYEATIVGIRPLLMHNGRLADPLDPAAIKLGELTHKKKKTMEDHAAIARAEWEGGLYLADGKVAIPGDMLDALIRDGGKDQKKGKAMTAGVEVETDAAALDFEGPRDWKKLYDHKLAGGATPFVDRKGAKVARARVIRTRPRFPVGWSLTFRIARYGFASVGEADIKKALEFAGYAVGLGDFRPRYGLFRVEKFGKAKD